jgi:hypothetical protein
MRLPSDGNETTYSVNISMGESNHLLRNLQQISYGFAIKSRITLE